MRRILSAILAAVVFVSCFSLASCSLNNDSADSEGKVKVVTTIFPVYDWARNVAGEDNSNVDITMLLDSGIDLHNYQPSSEDILKISDCDVFIYVGGESDEWVESALKKAENKDMVTLNLTEALGDMAKEEESIEGMQEEEGEEHEDEAEYDEHIWLSLKNAAVLTDAIKDAMCDADSSNKETYESNADEYKGRISELDSAYADAADNASYKTLIFADRFPFRYMTDDYGLSYYAAFKGCSAETEASFETVAFLAKKADELGVRSIMTIEGSDGKIAKTVLENTENKDMDILSLNSMQSVTSEDVENGAAYLSIMEDNLDVLKKALK